jgi:hypothetical protein
MRQIFISLILLAALPLLAQEAGAQESDSQESGGGPLFMKHLVGDREFYEPWGIGVDFYTMDQDYGIKQLEFALPGVGLDDPSLIDVSNELQHLDLRLDVWLTPFLNVYGLVGRVDANTLVDLSKVPITGLPIALGTLPISYDGTVWGGGFTLAYGGEWWFVSVNNTWTTANLSGGFDSSISSFTSQPRLGLIRDQWTFWVGGMYLDTNEKHKGTIELPIPGIPPVPFNVELESLKNWNYVVGAGYVFSPKATVYLEYGFGDRTHTLFNFTYRF